MIVDPSALISILRFEEDSEALLRAVWRAQAVRLSAAGYLETAIVIDAPGDPIVSRRLDEFIRDVPIDVAPITAVEARIARDAYRDFGKGSGHPARLNFGDCFSYALAKSLGEPLLFKGDDFIHTDVAVAVK